MKTTITSTTGRILTATASGNDRVGYYAQVKARNGRIVWESDNKFAFAEAAHTAAAPKAATL